MLKLLLLPHGCIMQHIRLYTACTSAETPRNSLKWCTIYIHIDHRGARHTRTLLLCKSNFLLLNITMYRSISSADRRVYRPATPATSATLEVTVFSLVVILQLMEVLKVDTAAGEVPAVVLLQLWQVIAFYGHRQALFA